MTSHAGDRKCEVKKSNETVFAFTEENIELGTVSGNDLICNAMAVTGNTISTHSLLIFTTCLK